MFRDHLRAISNTRRVSRRRRQKGFIASNLSLIVGIVILVAIIIVFFHLMNVELVLPLF